MNERRCYANGCKRRVDSKFLMCQGHWHMVPKPLQLAVWRAYRAEQLVTLQPSYAWYVAAADAIEAVARRESRPINNALRRRAQQILAQAEAGEVSS